MQPASGSTVRRSSIRPCVTRATSSKSSSRRGPVGGDRRCGIRSVVVRPAQVRPHAARARRARVRMRRASGRIGATRLGEGDSVALIAADAVDETIVGDGRVYGMSRWPDLIAAVAVRGGETGRGCSDIGPMRAGGGRFRASAPRTKITGGTERVEGGGGGWRQGDCDAGSGLAGARTVGSKIPRRWADIRRVVVTDMGSQMRGRGGEGGEWSARFRPLTRCGEGWLRAWVGRIEVKGRGYQESERGGG